MAKQWLFVEANAPPAKLNEPLTSGQSVSFVSTLYNSNPDPQSERDLTSVNLVNGNDIPFHISIRRKENRILFDTRRGPTWDENYQVIDLQGVFPGPGAIITVASNDKSYDVSFNNDSTIHTFPKRIDADATAVSYGANNESLVFSDPIVAGVFDNGVFISPSISS